MDALCRRASQLTESFSQLTMTSSQLNDHIESANEECESANRLAPLAFMAQYGLIWLIWRFAKQQHASQTTSWRPEDFVPGPSTGRTL